MESSTGKTKVCNMANDVIGQTDWLDLIGTLIADIQFV